MKTKRQNEIIAKEKEAKELQKKYFGTEGDLYKKRQELVKPIQDKVYNAIEELAEEGGFAVIFDRTGSTTIIYASEKFDKSDDVLAKLGYKAGGVSQ
jgi:outer membrane protein